MKKTLRWLGPLALCLGIVVSIAQPAYAASTSSSCSTGLFQTQCKTGSVAANASGHWVDVYIDLMPYDGVSWRVVDDSNGQTVASGNVSSSCSSFLRRISGLYGNYHLTVYNAGAGMFAQLSGVSTAYNGACH